MTFIIDNLEMFQADSQVHAVSTRHRHDLHRPVAKKDSKFCDSGMVS